LANWKYDDDNEPARNLQTILQLVDAAFAAAAPGVPSWAAGYDNGNDLGGLVSAVLEPAGDFGKVLIVIMALAISAPTAPTMYSFGMFCLFLRCSFLDGWMFG
jgi:hypothetical protein